MLLLVGGPNLGMKHTSFNRMHTRVFLRSMSNFRGRGGGQASRAPASNGTTSDTQSVIAESVFFFRDDVFNFAIQFPRPASASPFIEDASTPSSVLAFKQFPPQVPHQQFAARPQQHLQRPQQQQQQQQHQQQQQVFRPQMQHSAPGPLLQGAQHHQPKTSRPASSDDDSKRFRGGPSPPFIPTAVSVSVAAVGSTQPASLPHTAAPRIDASFMSLGRFSGLGLSAPTSKSMKEVFGFDSMTVVQHSTIPAILEGKDVLARAKTGAILALPTPCSRHTVSD
jgi:hypothetical protein